MSFTNTDEAELLKKFPSVEERLKLEEKHEKNFEKYARYMGNGVYSWKGINAVDTRQLFLLGILAHERIYYSNK